jgi:hypothetical protein
VLINNGTVAGPPTPEMPFAPYAADLTLLSLEFSNCYADNLYSTSFWFFGALPTCP